MISCGYMNEAMNLEADWSFGDGVTLKLVTLFHVQPLTSRVMTRVTMWGNPTISRGLPQIFHQSKSKHSES